MSTIQEARDLVHTALGIVQGEIVGGESEVVGLLDETLTLLDRALDPREFERAAKEAVAVASSAPTDDICPGVESGGPCTCTDGEVFGDNP